MPGELPEACEVAIVGGGPAGLAAAGALRAAGIGPVVVLEREPAAGGIPRHCGHFPFGMREFNRMLRGPDYARRLVAKAEASGAAILTDTTVISMSAGPVLDLSTPDGLRKLKARRVLLCTGVRERSRAARLIGGTKPGGVMSTGALQGLVYLEGLRPFDHPVILGTELVSFSALLTCRHMNIRPVAMIEPGSRTTARWPAPWLPRLMGVPLMLDTELAAIHGTSQVSEVVLRDAAGAERIMAADGVIVTGQFLPEASLMDRSHLAVDPGSGGPEIDQFGRCSDPDYFAAGNLLRAVETAGWCWAEGRRAGAALAHSLSGKLPPPQAATRVKTQGDALKYVVPQRIVATGPSGLAAGYFQLRVARAVSGRLALRLNGTDIWSSAIRGLPERRIFVPFSALPPGAEGTVEFSIMEAAP